MSMIGTAASLAKKKAELAALNNVTLPRLHQSIGRRIAGIAKLPPALAEQVTRIRQLEAAIAAGPVDSAASGEGGFAAKAKRLAQKAAKATADAATGIQITSAYATLGREAVRQFGEKAVPKELAAEFTTLNAQQQSLAAEIKQLEETHSGGVVTPKRLVVAGMLVAVLFGGVVLIKGVGSLFGFGGPRAPDWRDSFSSRRESRRNDGLQPDLQATVEHARQQQREHAVEGMSRALGGILDTWRSKTDDAVKPLNKDYRVAGARSDLKGEALVEFDAAAEKTTRRLKEVQNSSQTRLQAQLAEMERKYTSEVTREKSADGNWASLRGRVENEFRAVCDADAAALAKAREDATDELNRLAKAPEERKKKFEAALKAELLGVIAKWSKPVLPLGQLESEKQLKTLSGLKDVTEWNKEFAEAARLLRHMVDQSVADQEGIAESIAEGEGVAFAKGLAEAEANDRGLKRMQESLARVKSEAEQRRSDTVNRLVDWHARAMKQQSDREESTRQAKELASQRKYEGEQSLTDDELIEAIRLAPDITDLWLGRSQRLTDRCLPAIASLKNLRLLNLDLVEGMTPQGMLELKDKKLKDLTLPQNIRYTDTAFGVYVAVTGRATGLEHSEGGAVSKLTDEGVEALRGAPYVFTLTLPTRVTDRGLAALQDIPRLKEVSVPLSPGVTDKGLASLGKCKHLRLLKFTWPYGAEKTTSVTPRGIEALKSLRLLELDLPSELHTEEFFAPALQTLSDSDADKAERDLPAGVAGRDWPSLRTWDTNKRIIHLSGRQSDIAGRGFGDFGEWPCTPRTLLALVGQRGIKEVFVRNAKVEQESLACLGKLPDLEKLTLTEVQTTGSGLETLRDAKNLRFLGVINCPTFDVAGVKAVAQCGQLNTINLSGVPKLGDAELLLLTANKGLRQLFVARSRATGSLVVKLQNAMPECHVEVND
jgi:hypothetical protein